MVDGLPVAVIGAGPVGLAAAAELEQRGLPVLVLEKGATAGAAVGEWGHVRLFSSWRDLIAPAAEKILAAEGRQRPADAAYPTGAEWVRTYLRPLADALGNRGRVRLRFGTEAIGVARRGRDRVVDAGRSEQPFTVHIRGADGAEERILARAVIDASGTWTTPNPLGADGLPALGELDASVSDGISHRIPDLADAEARRRYGGRRTAVVGRGHSALTTLVALSELAEAEPGTRVLWVLRRGEVGDAFGGGEADRLAARGALGIRAKAAVDAGRIELATGFRTAAVRCEGGRVVLADDSGRELGPVDEVVALTGFRPDLSWLSEVRLGLDPPCRHRSGWPPSSTPTCTPAARSTHTGPRSSPTPSPASTWRA